ncbi:serine/threonine-protein kinase 11-interacting protein [Dendroctonus ponderosae]|uniref:LKB1 serine/threonine kinase interacting protein 1 N-terminal domain-containing protein n=1 Tax=Dendroctonus ponderosae TaxID=77166 RepID=A0AAR5Q6A0_DENPD|nr:serine/threonine-protein kinase 11-interacting protein [Dendroctonus ponderosae]KAH1029238.1 hypothetical protein HUJ05_002510 [Dendroctonus ponderosae]
MSDMFSTLAEVLRPVGRDISKGRGKLCLSSTNLAYLNKAFDENWSENLSTSFHQTEAKAALMVDLQFLLDLVKSTVALKVVPDASPDPLASPIVNLQRFQSLKSLEIQKLDLRNIVGIQQLRARLEDLTSMHNLEHIADILDKCGGDCSQVDRFNWSELKRLNLSHNRIRDVEPIFDATPWLQVLDLSSNEIGKLDPIEHLPNLKMLNLSFNKLEAAPRFKGPVTRRLQTLKLNNNFLEDISGLSTLSNLQQLDLAQNCLIDHNVLLSIAQIGSLYCLDLRGNPISFHRQHRTLTCNYLNKNVASLNVVLNNEQLSKSEKSLTGSLRPVAQSSLELSSSERARKAKPRRVRNVVIQEGFGAEAHERRVEAVSASPRSLHFDRNHLDVKKKIEQMSQSDRKGWLWHQSGMDYVNFLNFPQPAQENSGAGSCPSEEIRDAADVEDEQSSDSEVVNGIFFGSDSGDPELSDDDDLLSGEPFLAKIVPGMLDIGVLITKRHMLERNAVTSEVKSRWFLGSVRSCQRGEEPNQVLIQFDSPLKEKMSRNYIIDDPERFVKLLLDGRQENMRPEERIQYQCMKCSSLFSRTKEISLHVEVKVTCPKCESNLVVVAK